MKGSEIDELRARALCSALFGSRPGEGARVERNPAACEAMRIAFPGIPVGLDYESANAGFITAAFAELAMALGSEGLLVIGTMDPDTPPISRADLEADARRLSLEEGGE